MGIASDFVLILIAALAGGIFARILRLPLLVGYVLAGIFVGPYTAGPRVVEVHDIELLAEIGVALLLFSLGLEVSFRDLRYVRSVALLGGSLQIFVTIVAGALAATYGFGMERTEATWFGAMISVSSTMVVLKTLSSGGLTSTLASRVMIGILVVQDLAVIPMLILLPQLGKPGSALSKLLPALAVAAASVLVIFLLGTRLLPKLLKYALAWGSRELFLVAVVAIGVGMGYLATAVGLSFALGAFIAGLVLSESEFSHQALSDVVPLRDIFGLLFFVTVGMLFDPHYAWAHAGEIVIAITLILAGKSLVIGAVTRAFGYGNMAPWIVGLGLSQIGEFSFVLARAGLSSGALSKSTYDLTLTCTVVTMALSPLVSKGALPLGRVWQARRKAKPALKVVGFPEDIPPGHVIVAGYGRTGRAVARALKQAGIPQVIIELNHSVISDITAEGFTAIFGDVTREEILRAAHVERAKMLLLTVPDQTSVQLAIQRAQRLNPSLLLVARAVRERNVSELRKLGVVAAVQAEFEGGVEMVRQALVQLRHDEEATLQIMDRLRRELYSAEGEV